jgi:hypothetical protein
MDRWVNISIVLVVVLRRRLFFQVVRANPIPNRGIEHEKEKEKCDRRLRVDIRSHGQYKDQAHEGVALKECLVDACNVQMRGGPMLVNQGA